MPHQQPVKSLVICLWSIMLSCALKPNSNSGKTFSDNYNRYQMAEEYNDCEQILDVEEST